MIASERGAAPTLAIFVIFVIVSTGLVIAHLQSSNQEEINTIQNYTAADVTQATSDSINSELNKALRTSISAAMYDVGKKSRGIDTVENIVIKYMNRKISEGWKYPNIEVKIPSLKKSSTHFNWRPDGSLSVTAYLKSKLKHVKGPASFGMVLKANISSRFIRIKNVTNQILKKVNKVSINEIEEFEEELNDNYQYEGIRVDLKIENSHLKVNVKDVYGSKRVIIQK